MFMLLGLLKISPVITLFFIITMGGVGGPLYHIYNQCPPQMHHQQLLLFRVFMFDINLNPLDFG